MGQSRKSDMASEKSGGGFSYTHSFELKDRYLYMDVDYLQNEEGRFKLIEIALCLLGIFLSAEVRGISGERGFAMITCAVAILLTFTVWIAKIFTLHRQLHPGNWFLIETLIYIFIIGGLVIAAGLMAFFATAHWTVRNPEWQTMPLLSTVVLFGAAIAYLLDLIILFKNRKNRTFIPDVSSYQI